MLTTYSECKTEEMAKVKPSKVSPDGWQKGKEKPAIRHMRAKNLKLVESVAMLQDLQHAEITRRKEILLFTNCPGGVTSARAPEYFTMKQKKFWTL